MTDLVYIPISRKLYDDIVRFSDGQIDPADMAEAQLEAWVARDLETGSEDHWGERFEDAAAVYAPHLVEKLKKEQQQAASKQIAERRPLVWKDITVPAGSEVRMSYKNVEHYAEIKAGRIVDYDGTFTPSEWASKVADNTSRNAWRDLWFRKPLAKNWVSAQQLRLSLKYPNQDNID